MAKKPTSTRKNQKIKPKPRVHKELDGLEVSIDTFGEIRSSMNIEKINEFLNKNVDDKKLLEREEAEERKKKGKTKK
ncbi:MAG: hypothetical protein HOP08_08965 [Cyclobacteriaceae bacterium]|nr:hypothetical protein [Cyclobacteriaceae bacterium]